MSDHPAPPQPMPWGPRMSLLLAALVVAVSQAVGGIVAASLANLSASDLRDSSSLLANGTFLSYTAAVAAPVCLGLVWSCVRLRNGPRLRDYLALHPVSLQALLGGMGATAVLAAVEHAANVWLGRPIPEFVANVYRSAGHSPLLWLAFVVCAPIAEEVVFRGFLFAGLLGVPGRTTTAVVITAMTFTSLHLGQYGAWDLVFLFGFGMLLGVARARSGSLYLPIAMHMSMNLAALLGTAAQG